MGLAKVRSEVYGFFDTTIKPIIMERGASEETVEECYDIIDKKFSKSYRWIVRQYDNTIRVSAHCSGLGYLFFMIATPDGVDEYDFGTVYHGSRKETT